MKTNEEKFREYLNNLIELNQAEANNAEVSGVWKIAMDGKVDTLKRISAVFDYYFPVEVPGEPVTSDR